VGPSGLMSVGDLVYFYRDTPGMPEIWRTDGTTEGTFKLLDAWPTRYSSGVPEAVELNGKLIFSLDGPTSGLWISDGTVAGTKQLSDVGAYDIVRFGNQIYFEGYDSAHGGELWSTDGTAAGTNRITEIGAGTKSAGITELFATDDALYFNAVDDLHGSELWKLPIGSS
jgi:ELWxxDGT repeat protein